VGKLFVPCCLLSVICYLRENSRLFPDSSRVSKSLLTLRLLCHELADLEESLIRQKILSHIKYGGKPDLIRMTKLAGKIISVYLNNLLLKQLNSEVFNYAVMTGIMIHRPKESN
jgi:Limiting CO2-inducible proteins B/C beta carbonyic anhydrases